MLKSCSTALWDEYDVAMLDLDGVVYVGRAVVPGAAEHLSSAARSGMHLAYVTNNASRPPSEVAKHLRELGIPATDEDVVTSAQAAARLVAELVPAGSAVFVIGGAGLFEALAELDLKGVQTIGEDPVAVVSGFNPDLIWQTVIDGAILVSHGLPWVAANMDLTVPTAEGVGPGNGVLVSAVARFAGRDPVVAGKPEPPLFEETRRRVGGSHPLVVGDRLDTDIEGAENAGLDSLLVMTGVTGAEELAGAGSAGVGTGSRPSYISCDLGGLGTPHPLPVALEEGGFSLNGWTGRVDKGVLALDGEGSPDDWWRVMAVAAWQHFDTTGSPADVSGLSTPGSVSTRAGLDTQEPRAGQREDGDSSE